MKTIKIYTIIFFAFLFPIAGEANQWNTTDHGFFSYQKDIEHDLSDYSEASSTIYFHGKLFNFINYYWGNQVIVRKLSTPKGQMQWSDTKQEKMANLTGFYSSEWQPSPAVFNGNLILFVVKSDRTIGYTVYDSIYDSWSAVKAGPVGCDGEYMAAVNVLDKLCLVTREKSTGKASIYWTKDLVNWTHFQTGMDCANFVYCQDIYYWYHISAISKSWIDSKGKLSSKIMVAYIVSNQTVRVAEFAFDASENLYQIRDLLAASEYTYSSASLAEGSVKGDPSTGICTQLFLKKATKDNGYCRYRILRYQMIEGGSAWTKQENNLVKQNYMWAANVMDLNAVNFPMLVVDPGINSGRPVLKQYMCLVYRGYDDFDHPLNCAWAETDHLNFINEKSKELTDPSNIQYLGYVESAPPFYLNHASANFPNDPYVNRYDRAISEVEYSNTVVTENTTDLAFDVQRSVSVKVAGFKADFSYLTGTQKGHETRVTETTNIAMPSAEESSAYYLCQTPTIFRDQYDVYDVNNKFLYSTYDFHLQENWLYINVPLKPGLIAGNPESYMDSTTFFYGYDMFGSDNISWTKTLEVSSSIEIETSQSVTSSRGGSLTLGLDFGEFLDLGVEGKFDYSLKTTTMSGNELHCSTRLNDPVDSTDVVKLNYQIYWLRRTEGQPNWWLNPAGQDAGQQTWCLSYETTYVEHKNGVRSGNSASSNGIAEEGRPNENIPVVQNWPNPFTSVTTIQYSVGSEDQKGMNDSRQVTTLSVYDCRGNFVTNLVNETKAPGKYEVKWDASFLSSGFYFCRLRSGNHSYACKLVLAR